MLEVSTWIPFFIRLISDLLYRNVLPFNKPIFVFCVKLLLLLLLPVVVVVVILIALVFVLSTLSSERTFNVKIRCHLVPARVIALSSRRKKKKKKKNWPM